MPRVKHDYKQAILNCEEINYSEYKELQQRNANDPYLQCHSIQEQRRYPEVLGRVIKNEGKEKRHHNLSTISFRRRKEQERLMCQASMISDYLRGECA